MRGRVKKIFRNLKGLDAIVIQNSLHRDAAFFYFTGIQEGLFENASVILRPPGDIELVSYILEKESAVGGDYDLTLHETRDGTPFVLERLEDCETIGINPTELTLAKFKRLEKGLPDTEFVDISKDLNAIRIVKDRKEISLMRKACKIASRVAEEIPGMVTEGMTEAQLSAEITAELMRRGSSKLAFDTLVCFGANAAIAHHIGGDKRLKKGEFVLCDFGGAVGVYCSDITRTFVLGKATSKQKRIHKAVKKAQAVGLRAIRDGVNGRDVHKKVDRSITRSGFKGKFTHSTGHGLGIDVHDCGAVLHSEVDMPLRAGMVFTVEPGIYLSGYGGVRIEDDVVIRKDGVESLTNACKDLIEIERKR